MTSFKVKEVNKEQNWIAITVTFDDGEVYDKRMMVSGTDQESIISDVTNWLKDYEPLRKVEKESPDVKSISLNKKFTISPKVKEEV